jgi:hypothetical protein
MSNIEPVYGMSGLYAYFTVKMRPFNDNRSYIKEE